MKRTPIIPIKWINEGHDSDWDGVPNYRDCEILNPHKHGIKSGLKKYINAEKQEQQMREINDYSSKFYGKSYDKLTKSQKDKVFLFLDLHKKYRLSWKKFHELFTKGSTIQPTDEDPNKYYLITYNKSGIEVIIVYSKYLNKISKQIYHTRYNKLSNEEKQKILNYYINTIKKNY